jgi:hypothetical protein
VLVAAGALVVAGAAVFAVGEENRTFIAIIAAAATILRANSAFASRCMVFCSLVRE